MENQIYEAKKLEQLYLIDPKTIVVPENFNMREDFGDLDELMGSIIEIGVQNPLRGRKEDESYILTDGERRLRAVLKAISEGHLIARVPFIIEPKTYTDAQRYLDQIICNSGKPFTPIEQAKVFNKLITFGWDEKEIASKVGKSVVHVKNMLTLYHAPSEIQEVIREGKISSTLAVEIINEHIESTDEQVKTIEEAVKHAEVKGKKKVTKKVLRDMEDKNTLGKKESPTKSNKYENFDVQDLDDSVSNNTDADTLSYVDTDSYVESEFRKEAEGTTEYVETKKKKDCSIERKNDLAKLINLYNTLDDAGVLNTKVDILLFVINILQDPEAFSDEDILNYFSE